MNWALLWCSFGWCITVPLGLWLGYSKGRDAGSTAAVLKADDILHDLEKRRACVSPTARDVVSALDRWSRGVDWARKEGRDG